MKTYSVVIADDHPFVRKGIRDTIVEDGRFTVVDEVSYGDWVCDSVRRHAPNFLVLDLNLPRMHGIEIIKLLKKEEKIPHIIVMTMHKEEEIVDAVRELGVRGYLLKESAESNLIQCMEKVLDGEYYLSPELSSYLLSKKQRVETSLASKPALETLTAAEKNVLRLIAQHLTSREIGEMLHISVNTVNNHRNNICRKLDLHGINGLLKFAIEHKGSL